MKSIWVVPAMDKEDYIDYGKMVALQYGFPFRPRNGKTIRQLLSLLDSALLVVHNQGCYYINDQSTLRYHMGLAPLRLKQLQKGKTDFLIEALDLQGDETVIDATFGLGADALVMASFLHAASGQVIGLESAGPIFYVAFEGIRRFKDKTGLIQDKSRNKIHLLHQNHRTYLKGIADDSVDVVFFDPMFQYPVSGSYHLQGIRSFANDDPVTSISIQEAMRVARKKVVIKERRNSILWSQWPIDRKVGGKYSNIAYGVINCER